MDANVKELVSRLTPDEVKSALRTLRYKQRLDAWNMALPMAEALTQHLLVLGRNGDAALVQHIVNDLLRDGVDTQ